MTRPKAKLHQVPVVATKDVAGATQFTGGSDIWDDPQGALHFHKDDHGMSKDDYHLVEFVLDDRTGDDLRFASGPHDAMWVSKVEDPAHPVCPGKDTTSDYTVLEPICVCDDGKRLIVRNDNPRKEQWAFTLNFIKQGENEDANRYVSWDPITQNHNGGG
jgi:hypothetical protein